MNRWGCLAATVVVLLLLACAGMAAPAEAAFLLVTGWMLFLSRVAPQVTVNWPGIATAIVALAVFVTGVQWLGDWWMSAVQANKPPEQSHLWKRRWSVIFAVAVVLSFTAGIAVVGATHQMAWMATSDEPIAESSWKGYLASSATRNNLRQIGVALHNLNDAHQHFPAGGVFDPLGRPLFSWQTALLPYVDQQALFDRIDLKLPWDAAANLAALAVEVPTYIFDGVEPDERRDFSGRALTHFAGNGRVLNANPGLALSAFKDDTSNTLLAGQAKAQFKPWGYPVNWRDAALGINRAPEGFGSPWNAGANFLLADGSVRFVSENIDAKVLEALATPDGGEPVGEF